MGTTREDTGTGLGLWISAGIVHRHYGGINVKSGEAEGRSGTTSAYFFRMPERHTAHKTRDGFLAKPLFAKVPFLLS